MEVICCGGIALQANGRFIPWRVVTISADGRILDRLMSENVQFPLNLRNIIIIY